MAKLLFTRTFRPGSFPNNSVRWEHQSDAMPLTPGWTMPGFDVVKSERTWLEASILIVMRNLKAWPVGAGSRLDDRSNAPCGHFLLGVGRAGLRTA